MKILVTFALENEFAPWRAMRSFRPGKWGAADAHFAQIGDAEVGVILTGVGPRAAKRETSKVIFTEHDEIHCVISSGLAGALRPEYEIGHVLAALSVYSGNPQDDLETRVLLSSAALVSFAADCGATVVNRFCSANHVVSTANEKRELGAGADAVEMESFDVLLRAAEFGIPAMALRAVSDLAAENLPLDMSEVLTDQGQVSIPRVLGQVARNPQSLPSLVRLGQNSKRASESLAKILDNLVLAVAEKSRALETRATTAGGLQGQ